VLAAQGGAPTVAGMPNHNSESRTIVLRYIEALQRGDLAAARASFTPDATWWFPRALPISGNWTGPEAIIDDFLAKATARLDPESIDFEVRNLVAEGAQAVLEWVSRATTLDGARYENANSATFVVRDSRIHAVREYTDTRYSARVLFDRR
jgi:uncharacterized protein